MNSNIRSAASEQIIIIIFINYDVSDTVVTLYLNNLSHNNHVSYKHCAHL